MPVLWYKSNYISAVYANQMDKFLNYKGLHLDRLWNGQSSIAYLFKD